MSLRRSARLQAKKNEDSNHEEQEVDDESQSCSEQSSEEATPSESEQKEENMGETDLLIEDALTQHEFEEIVQNNPNLETLQLELPYECDTVFNFDGLEFLHLESLQLNCINMENGIDFKKENFPKLESLDVTNINCKSNEGCDFDFVLPELKTLSMAHINCNDQTKFAESISKCAKLESFSSYKFRVFGGLNKVALLNVQTFAMSRAECMTSLSLWAPKLEQLSLRSNWDLRTVHLLSSIPSTFDKQANKVKIPKSKYSAFDVKLIYCDPKIKVNENRIRSIDKVQANDW